MNIYEMNQAELVEALTVKVWERSEMRRGLNAAERVVVRWWQLGRKKRRAFRRALWLGRLEQREVDIERIVALLVQTSAQFYAKAKAWESRRRDRRQGDIEREMADQQRWVDAQNAATKEQSS